MTRIFTLSAATPAELEAAALPDGSSTEAGLAYRRVVVAADPAEAARRLRGGRPTEVFTAEAGPPRPVVLMFAGVGDQYPGMAAGLYHRLPVFRRELDRCLDLFESELGTALRPVLYPDQTPAGEVSLAALLDRRDTAQSIHRTLVAQPLAFATQYALARSLQALGITASALVGHSLGEYVAACLAGVFTLGDAVHVVALRARLIDALPEGAMLAVAASPGALSPYLGDGLSIASLDGPELTVLSGPADLIDQAGRQLMDDGVAVRRPPTTHAFHSPMMEPAAERLGAALAAIRLRAPATPLLSNVTGTWISDAEATAPGYWTRHLCRPVRFADDLTAMWSLERPIPIEVGPGRTLTNLAMRHPGHGDLALRTLPGVYETRTDLETFLTTIGALWATGLDVPLGALRWEP